jgi:hypothetical protein
MAKYSQYRKPSKPRAREIHPIWRGIGCLLIIIVPLITYALTVLFIQLLAPTGFLPPWILGKIHFPAVITRIPVITILAGWLSGINNLIAQIIFFFPLLLLLTGIGVTVYATIYETIGPSPYGDQDVPPGRHRVKNYKR